MDPHIHSRLAQVQRRRNRARLALKLAGCWAGATLAGVVLLLVVGHRNGRLPEWPLPFVAGIGLLAGAAVLFGNSRKRPDWRELALRIECGFPSLDGRLITAMQQEPDATGRLSFLQERLIREVLTHARRHDWSEIVPESRVFGSWLVQALTFLCFAGVLWAMRPGASPPAFAADSRAEPEVVPGDVSVERGASLVVMVRFAENQVPAGAELLMEPESGRGRQVALVRGLADPVFGITLPDVQTNFSYRVRYAGEQTRPFRVSVFDYPRLERSDAQVAFPAYTGLEPRRIENTRRVTAVEQSRIGLALQLNKPVSSAQLVPRATNGGPAVDLVAASNAPMAALDDFPLITSGAYDLVLRDHEGRTNKVAAQFVFEALPNREPELKLTRPRGDLRPSPLEEIAFEGTAWDDFGVRAYGLGYTVAGSETRFVELGREVPAGQKRPFRHLLRLEELGAEPDQLISWFVWSEDMGPDGEVRRNAGDLFFAEVRPFDEVFREGQGMEGESDQQQPGQPPGGQGSQSAQLADLQKKIMSATWRLQRDQRAVKRPANPEPGNGEQPSRRDTIRSSGIRPPWTPGAFFAAIGPAFGQPRDPQRNRQSAARRDDLSRSSGRLADDAAVIREAQAEALSQAQQARERQQDQRAGALWSAAAREMQRVLELLEKASKSSEFLPEALAAEQAAYQALLKLQEHEHQVSRARRQRGQQGASSREQQMRPQLDQLDLTQSENRYETERQAQRPQSAERREQVQVMSRLEELARRQQDLNERLQELQAALQAAANEQEREELRRRLKRLQEEQQELVADADELQQRMQRPENQSRMAEERRQMEQARDQLQRAAEAARQGAVPQALASGTRAQRQLQEMREEMRRQSSSQFAQDLQELRSQSRHLAREQEEILKEMQRRAASEPGRQSLSSGLRDLPDRLARQEHLLTNVLDQAAQVARDSEPGEPLLSRQLYDTLRKFNQDSAEDLKQAQEEVMRRGMMTRSLYDRLQETPGQDGAKMMDLTGELLEMNFDDAAVQAGNRSRERLDELKRGVERAAENVLGDDTEALRLAQKELDDLTRQVEEEIATAEGRGTSTNRVAGTGGDRDAQTRAAPGQSLVPRGDQPGSDPTQAGSQAKVEQASSEPRDRELPRSAPGGTASRPGAGERPPTTSQEDGNPTPEAQERTDSEGQARNSEAGRQSGDQPARQPADGQSDDQTARNGQRGGSRRIDLDRILGGAEGRGGGGPMLGEAFVDWSDRLRAVEEMVEIPELRTEIAGARDRARVFRRDLKREGRRPDWAQVRLQVVNPLVEVRDEIAQELARRGSKEALVPIDRDPVPGRFSDLVRRYYEALGKD